MNLKILIPSRVLVDQSVTKVVAEAENGSFALLPRHVDFAAALVPGILSFQGEQGEKVFVAVDEGVLVKVGDEVLVSTLNAVRGEQLGQLRRILEDQFRTMSELEKKSRTAVARIEGEFIRGFLEFGHKS